MLDDESSTPPEQEAEAKAETKPKSKEVATSGEKGEYKSKSTEELKGLLQKIGRAHV